LPLAGIISDVDAALGEWQQGDVILGADVPFFHLADLTRPVTPQSEEFATEIQDGGDPLANIASTVPGFVVISQTCDLVRSSGERALVQVAALVSVDPATVEETKRGFRPRYAYIPEVEEQGLVADLTAIMTIEKSVLIQMPGGTRVRGCPTDTDARRFAEALTRSLGRFAFPDDFVAAIKPVQKRIVEKHGKVTRDKKGRPTAEGQVLETMTEIRVSCTPSWTAAQNELVFYFIFDDRRHIPADADDVIEAILGRFKPTGIFKAPTFRIVTLNEMSAAAYKSSDPLDLDNLSAGA
jgi:hypothetical protein